MQIAELYKQTNNIIWLTQIIPHLKPGMIVRIATSEELVNQRKSRYTGSWGTSVERDLCYISTEKPEFREFILTQDAIDSIQRGSNSIYLHRLTPKQPLPTKRNYGSWIQEISEIIMVTEEKQYEKILFQLVEIKTKDLLLNPIILSSNEKLVKTIKAKKEEALTAEEKENTEYRILAMPVVSTEISIKEEQKDETVHD